MARLASVVAGRRGKWLVVAAWAALLAALAPLGARLPEHTDDRTESFLPRDAQATRAIRALERDFPGGQTTNGLIVYERAGGLTAGDRARIARDAGRLARAIPVRAPPAVPFAGGGAPGLVSRDGAVAVTAFHVRDDGERVAEWGARARELVGAGGGGLRVYVTGDLGFTTDAERVFESIDATLLLATVALVLVLLGAIYRSPAIAAIPLLVVGGSYAVARALIDLYARTGATVSTTATSILVVLMFGVGTDYCLLLVARYREELRRHEDRHEAMQRALARSGPAILASGLTVALSMLVLLVAETGSTHSLGPVAAIGVACVTLAGVTLLPALLTAVGRGGFWPRRRSVAHAPGARAPRRHAAWRRLGDRVLRRPGWALALTAALFGAGALGLLSYREDHRATGFFKRSTESVEGFRALERRFPPGTLAPTTVVVRRDRGRLRAADLGAVAARLAAVPGVASVAPGGRRSRDGRAATLEVVLGSDPFGPRALETVPRLRRAVARAAPGVSGLVGGASAAQYDFGRSAARDLRLIVPIVLAVVAVILAALLAAVVAPLVLIATVLASFLGTLGMSVLFFRHVVGDPGVDSALPTLAFIFLVALGIDYTIFLTSRVREEARRHGTREGTLRALGATGAVITSAGIILAGTFSVLMTLPVTLTFDLGFVVALGVLLDTFVVRTVMLPAALAVLGDRVWWPSGPG